MLDDVMDEYAKKRDEDDNKEETKNKEENKPEEVKAEVPEEKKE